MAGTTPWVAQANVEPIAAVTIQALANSALYNVISGCDGTYSGANMNLTLAAGSVTHNSTVTTVAGNAVTLVSDPSNPRWTYTYVNSSGTAVLVSGSAAVTPAVPDPGANVTAQLTYVQAALTIASNATYKLDKRVMAVTATPFFNSLQAAFRTPRKLLALFSAVAVSAADGGGLYISTNIGVGLWHVNSASSIASSGTVTNLLLEAYTAQTTGATSTDMWHAATNASLIAGTAPNKNPRMSIRWFPGTSNASLTTSVAGFQAGGAAATATSNGAYLRANTTGNLFFVTRQGGSETTTDLGARPTALTSYEIETVDAGVTWTCRNVTTATVVATHIANVPTATVALAYCIAGVSASGNLNAYNVAYCEVESNTVA